MVLLNMIDMSIWTEKQQILTLQRTHTTHTHTHTGVYGWIWSGGVLIFKINKIGDQQANQAYYPN